MDDIVSPSTVTVNRGDDALVIHWEDGRESAFPHHWLKENAPENRHPLTGEKLASYAGGQDELNPWSVYIEYGETLVISWAGLWEVSRFSLDDLRYAGLIIESPELALSAD